MLTKAIIKYIKSLKDKKSRDEYGTFVAEGNKMVSDLLGTIKCQYLICTKEILSTLEIKDVETILEVKDNEIEKVSFVKNPQQTIAVFYKPKEYIINNIDNKLSIMLDEIQDPGNLGTIIRLADWYGIENIICSKNTADVYNPKTVQATMGALARVKVHYTDLEDFLTQNKNTPIYGTFLNGENMYQKELSQNGIIVMGNEGNGISKEIERHVNQRLFIPSYPPNTETSESLNVAIATAIVCAEFRRRTF